MSWRASANFGGNILLLFLNQSWFIGIIFSRGIIEIYEVYHLASDLFFERISD